MQSHPVESIAIGCNGYILLTSANPGLIFSNSGNQLRYLTLERAFEGQNKGRMTGKDTPLLLT